MTRTLSRKGHTKSDIGFLCPSINTSTWRQEQGQSEEIAGRQESRIRNTRDACSQILCTPASCPSALQSRCRLCSDAPQLDAATLRYWMQQSDRAGSAGQSRSSLAENALQLHAAPHPCLPGELRLLLERAQLALAPLGSGPARWAAAGTAAPSSACPQESLRMHGL